MGMLSSAIRNAPQAPAPDNTGERIATRLSEPLPRCTYTPGAWLSSEAWCWAPTRAKSSPPMREMLTGVSNAE
jgi:hypothetical protein